MANSQVTDLTELSAVAITDLLYIVDDPGGTPVSKKIVYDNLLGFANQGICNGRLTLETGVPVSTSDQTAKTTLYFTPYKGDKIAVYNGTNWALYTFTELSLSLAGYTASKNYDIWIYDNAGVLTLDSTVWTNDTTRATALATQDGVYIKSGDATRRYLGTIRINSTGGQCEDTVTQRFVWNFYNRLTKRLRKYVDSNWSYGTSTWRYANNDSSQKVEVVLGVSEDVTRGIIKCRLDLTNDAGWIAFGVDSGTVLGSTDDQIVSGNFDSTGLNNGVFTAHLNAVLSEGYHYLAWLERTESGSVTYRDSYWGRAMGIFVQFLC